MQQLNALATPLTGCRNKIARLLEDRRASPFDSGKQRTYDRLCAVEATILASMHNPT